MKALKIVNKLLSGVAILGIIGLGYTEYLDRQILSGKEVKNPIVNIVKEVEEEVKEEVIVEEPEKESKEIPIQSIINSENNSLEYNEVIDYTKEADAALEAAIFLGYELEDFPSNYISPEMAILEAQRAINSYDEITSYNILANISQYYYEHTNIQSTLIGMTSISNPDTYYDNTVLLESLGNNLYANCGSVAYMVIVNNEDYNYGVAANQQQYPITLLAYDPNTSDFIIGDVNHDETMVINLFDLAVAIDRSASYVLEIYSKY